MAESPVAALILAAGQSSRLGQPKQLVLLDGEPLIHRTARLALEAGCSPVVVVLGAAEEPCRAALADVPSITILSNPAWQQGMSTSLRTGLADLPPDTTVLMLVTDQVRLTTRSLRELLDMHRRSQAPVTAARYSGRLGVPAIFSPALLPALASIRGDKGARQLLEAWSAQAAIVDLPEAAADLDTPDDLRTLLQRSDLLL